LISVPFFSSNAPDYSLPLFASRSTAQLKEQKKAQSTTQELSSRLLCWVRCSTSNCLIRTIRIIAIRTSKLGSFKTPHKNLFHDQMVVVKRARMRPPAGLLKRNSSLASIRTDENEKPHQQRSNSVDSRRSRRRRVSFAQDFNIPPVFIPAPEPYNEEEAKLCFYSVRID